MDNVRRLDMGNVRVFQNKMVIEHFFSNLLGYGVEK